MAAAPQKRDARNRCASPAGSIPRGRLCGAPCVVQDIPAPAAKIRWMTQHIAGQLRLAFFARRQEPA